MSEHADLIATVRELAEAARSPHIAWSGRGWYPDKQRLDAALAAVDAALDALAAGRNSS